MASHEFSKVHFVSAVMLEIVASLKVVSGREQAQVLCPTVKCCCCVLGSARWHGSRQSRLTPLD